MTQQQGALPRRQLTRGQGVAGGRPSGKVLEPQQGILAALAQRRDGQRRDVEAVVAVSYTHLDVYKRQGVTQQQGALPRRQLTRGQGVAGGRPSGKVLEPQQGILAALAQRLSLIHI